MNEEYHINLIYKKITNEISDGEMDELNKWLNQSEENKITAKSVELAWNNGDSNIETPDVNLDNEFDSLEAKMKDDPAFSESEKSTVKLNQKPNEKSSRKLWFSLAASIAILLSVGYFFKTYSNKPQEWITVNASNTTTSVTLPDNTIINLNRNSSLSYPKKFERKQRLVKLKGEAFFKVMHNPKQPFVIETQYEKIEVLGTSFNVKAYDKESKSVVVVTEGKVQFASKDNQQNIILTKGNKGVFNRQSGILQKIADPSVNELAWHSKYLKFTDTPIPEVLSHVQNLYNIKFENLNPQLNNCLFTSTFDNQDLNVFIETISAVLGVDVVQINDTLYQINGGACE